MNLTAIARQLREITADSNLYDHKEFRKVIMKKPATDYYDVEEMIENFILAQKKRARIYDDFAKKYKDEIDEQGHQILRRTITNTLDIAKDGEKMLKQWEATILRARHG